VRWIDFLILILQTHAQSLARLAALFGEDSLTEFLESQEDPPHPQNLSALDAAEERFRRFCERHGELADWTINSSPVGNPYSELETCLQDLKLSPVLEFYVWAYPFYRTLVESPIELSARIQGQSNPAGAELVETALEEAKIWMRSLPVPPQLSLQAESAAQVPWLKFRSETLKKIGRRPLGPVY
jgi:hypothetical protein